MVSNDRDRSRGAAASGLARSDYWWVGVEEVGVGWRSGWYNLAKGLSAPEMHSLRWLILVYVNFT